MARSAMMNSKRNSEREEMVIELLNGGTKSAKDLAIAIGISPHMVRSVISSIRKKYQRSNGNEGLYVYLSKSGYTLKRSSDAVYRPHIEYIKKI